MTLYLFLVYFNYYSFTKRWSDFIPRREESEGCWPSLQRINLGLYLGVDSEEKKQVERNKNVTLRGKPGKTKIINKHFLLTFCAFFSTQFRIRPP